MPLPHLRTRKPENPDAKPPKQFAKGRQCMICGTPLSRYNPSPKYCYNHEPKPLALRARDV